MNKILKVKCPQCDKIFQYYTSESRLFCSEKCKMIDLGHWFEESYRVPIKGSQNEENLDDLESENFNLENIDETESEEYN